MRITFYNISKKQTDIIKGFAILIIVFHNFIHWTNTIGENEISFDPTRLYNLIHAIKESPLFLMNGLFSYFGHYGAPLFVFISGYGLSIMFQEKYISYIPYITTRVIKLYSLLLFGIFTFFLIFINHNLRLSFLKDIVLTLSMLKNLNSYYIYRLVGPWWFFSLLLQLYILFPVLFSYIKKNGIKGFLILLAINYLILICLDPLAARFDFPLYGNFIGQLPEFSLGIFLAIYSVKIKWRIVLIVLIVFILSNIYKIVFPFSFLTATILLLVFIYYLYFYSPKIILNFLEFVGRISMFIFIINGPLRQVSYLFWSAESSLSILLQSMVHFLFVLLVSYIMSIVYQKINLMNIIKYFKSQKFQ